MMFVRTWRRTTIVTTLRTYSYRYKNIHMHVRTTWNAYVRMRRCMVHVDVGNVKKILQEECGTAQHYDELLVQHAHGYIVFLSSSKPSCCSDGILSLQTAKGRSKITCDVANGTIDIVPKSLSTMHRFLFA